MPTIHKVAAIVIKDDAFFMVRKSGKDIWTSLGGKLEPGETEPQALLREIREEVDCDAVVGRKLGDFTDAAAFDPGTQIKLSVYLVTLKGEPRISDPELEEFVYVPKDYAARGIKLTPVITTQVIPQLIKERILNW